MRHPLLILLTFLLATLCACAAPGMIIDGKIAVAGNEPFSYLSLTGEDAVQYRLTGELAAALELNYQGQRVRLQGSLVKESVGPGYPAQFEVDSIVTTGEKSNQLPDSPTGSQATGD